MNLDIISLGLNHLVKAARWAPEVLWEGRMRCKMNKFTLLESPSQGTEQNKGKLILLRHGFFINLDYMNQSVAPKFAPTLPL